jgi:hypothetical protein
MRDFFDFSWNRGRLQGINEIYGSEVRQRGAAQCPGYFLCIDLYNYKLYMPNRNHGAILVLSSFSMVVFITGLFCMSYIGVHWIRIHYQENQ